MTLPEKIWARHGAFKLWREHRGGASCSHTEYTRSDSVEPLRDSITSLSTEVKLQETRLRNQRSEIVRLERLVLLLEGDLRLLGDAGA
jgi:hypothetical protein